MLPYSLRYERLLKKYRLLLMHRKSTQNNDWLWFAWLVPPFQTSYLQIQKQQQDTKQ